MRRLLTRASNSLSWLSVTINRNTGWLIAVAIVAFGLSNLAFLKDNEVIIGNIAGTTENTERISADTKTIITDLKQAVEDLKADNGRQTRILCRLILRGDVPLTGAEASDVERICQQAIKEADAAGASGSQSQPRADTTNPTRRAPAGKSTTPRTNPPAEKPPEQVGDLGPLVQPTLDAIADVLGGVL